MIDQVVENIDVVLLLVTATTIFSCIAGFGLSAGMAIFTALWGDPDDVG